MSRIGYALDLPATVKRLQATFPTPISVEAALWVPDRGIGTNISKAVGCDMMLLRGDGGLVCRARGCDAARPGNRSFQDPSWRGDALAR